VEETKINYHRTTICLLISDNPKKMTSRHQHNQFFAPDIKTHSTTAPAVFNVPFVFGSTLDEDSQIRAQKSNTISSKQDQSKSSIAKPFPPNKNATAAGSKGKRPIPGKNANSNGGNSPQKIKSDIAAFYENLQNLSKTRHLRDGKPQVPPEIELSVVEPPLYRPINLDSNNAQFNTPAFGDDPEAIIASGKIIQPYYADREVAFTLRQVLNISFSIDLVVTATKQKWTVFIPQNPVSSRISILGLYSTDKGINALTDDSGINAHFQSSAEKLPSQLVQIAARILSAYYATSSNDAAAAIGVSDAETSQKSKQRFVTE
jgi:hypothetical protein